MKCPPTENADVQSPGGERSGLIPEEPRSLDIERFIREWTRCSGWLSEALEHCQGTHTLGDVRDMVLRGEVVFWPGARCAVVTEFHFTPRMKILHIWLCAGDLGELLRFMLPKLECWGAEQGCVRFTTAGGKGWDRTLKPYGYLPSYSVCAKEIEYV